MSSSFIDVRLTESDFLLYLTYKLTIMAKPTITQDLDKVFEALAHKHRREIIYVLGLQPHSISQLARQRGLSLPAIHKHIKILEDADMVIHKKIGRTHFLTLNRQSLRGLQDWVMQYHPYWGNDKETLENYVNYLEKKDPPALKLRRGKKGGESK
jgi:DNA-binding transcriptional ArsR family regulator